MNSDREDGVSEVLGGCLKQINHTPALISLLYDADMMPEQIISIRGAISVAAVVEAFNAGRRDQIAETGVRMTEAEDKAADMGRICALKVAADWLETKADKARRYPGADLVRAEARADAYDNAAMTFRRWVLKEPSR